MSALLKHKIDKGGGRVEKRQLVENLAINQLGAHRQDFKLQLIGTQSDRAKKSCRREKEREKRRGRHTVIGVWQKVSLGNEN